MLDKTSKFAALVIVLGVAGMSSATAGPFLEAPVADESVEACVAEIRRHADYADAGSVLHNVEVESYRVVGHKLRIATTILDDVNGEAIRAYSTVCAVTPREVPSKFRIREIRR